MLAQNLLGLFVAALEQLLNFGICGESRLVGAVHHSAAVEILVGDGGKRHEAELLAHAVLRDHLAGKIGSALNVVRCAGCCDAEDDLLGCAAAEERLQLNKQLFAAGKIFFLLRGLHRVAERAGGVRDDGDLGDGLRVLLERRNQRVTDLVVRDDALFHVGQNRALLLGARDDDLKGDEKVLLIDGLAALPHRAEGSFVDEICQVRSDCASRCLRDLVKIHVLGQLDIFRVHAKRLVPALQIRPVDDDAPVEAARAKKRLVENLGPVRGREDDNALRRVKAVDLSQQLVQRLLALVVAAELGVSGSADGVDLINKDDGGSDLCSLLEEVAHAARADADEHFHKVRARNREERHVCLARDGLCKKRFARAGRAD